MAWTKDNVIAILALFATCAPIIVLATSALLRSKRRRLETLHE
jgi:hypothetical protein